MNKAMMLMAIGLGLAIPARAEDAMPPRVHPDSRNWQNLFRSDLADAIAPQGVRAFQDGVLTATKDENIWTKKEYADCMIDLEFKTSPSSNSGVFVYGSDLKKLGPQRGRDPTCRRFRSRTGQVPEELAVRSDHGAGRPFDQRSQTAG